MVTKATNSVLNLVDPPIDEIHLVTPLALGYGGTGKQVFPLKSFVMADGFNPLHGVAVDPHAVVVGNSDDGIGEIIPSSELGYALLSRGSSLDPSFQAITTDIITGILPVSKGGTGASTHGIGNLLVGNGTSPFQEVATASYNLGYPLISQGDNTAPQYAVMNVNKLIGTLIVAQGGTGQSTLPVNSVIIGNGTNGVLSAAPGTAGLPLISTGSGTPPVFNYLDASVIQNVLQLPHLPINVLAVWTVGSLGETVYTHTVVSGQTYLYFEAVGGGGGGASSSPTNPWSGGGGGGAGYAAAWAGPFTPGDVVTITIGNGGRGGASVGMATYDGEDGGTTSVGSFVTASGGGGGQVEVNVAGGNPGGGSALGIAVYGSEGGAGCSSDSTNQPGGHGGSSFFGGGAYSPANSVVNGSPFAVGSGGGGGWGLAGSVGAAGSPGYVIMRG